MKILVVDDDPAMLMVATMALEVGGGFEVIQANCGRDAIECARLKRPDAILMDLFMHDLDGPDVLEVLRAHESTLSIPVIFHTAKSDPSAVRDLLALGAKGVIGKPFNPVDLAGEISKILAS